MIGFIWLAWGWRTIKKLQSADISEWRVVKAKKEKAWQREKDVQYELLIQNEWNHELASLNSSFVIQLRMFLRYSAYLYLYQMNIVILQSSIFGSTW